MKIAVINETSAADRNGDILAALEGRGHEILNAGMKKTGQAPELTYIHTGFLAALLLNSGRADFVVGGCGTGIGFMNSALQYPGVVCGLVTKPLDAWLFAQINGGNCLSLQLLYEYGWAGDANLRFIFDALFSVESGGGYPPHRKESQAESRRLLADVSRRTHHAMAAIITLLHDDILRPALSFPGIMDLLDLNTLADANLATELGKRI
jgi:ribose 5-phosphate isomerase RpiB